MPVTFLLLLGLAGGAVQVGEGAGGAVEGARAWRSRPLQVAAIFAVGFSETASRVRATLRAAVPDPAAGRPRSRSLAGRGSKSGRKFFLMVVTVALLSVGIPLTLFLLKLLYNVMTQRRRNPSGSDRAVPSGRAVPAAEAVQAPAPGPPPSRMTGEAVQDPRTVMLETARAHAAAGRTLDAAETYEWMGDKSKAASYYAKAGKHDVAARLLQVMEEHEAAAEQWNAAGDPARAAACYEAGELYDAGGAARLEAGQPLEAAAAFEEGGHFSKAGEAYAAGGDLYNAARLFDAAGNKRQALAHYERLLKGDGRLNPERMREIAAFMESVKQHGRAAAVYARAGMVKEALHAAIEVGAVKQAASLYGRCPEDIGDDLLDRVGDHGEETAARYAQMFLKAGDFERAARVLEGLGRIEEAAETAAKGEDFEYAAELLEREGRAVKAAAYWERAGEPERAAELYKDAGRLGDAARCHKKTGEFFLSGELFASDGKRDLAIEAYQQVEPDSEHFKESRARIVSELVKDGALEQATGTYEAFREDLEPERAAELAYDIALRSEEGGRPETAAKMLRHVTSDLPSFRDAADRLAALEEDAVSAFLTEDEEDLPVLEAAEGGQVVGLGIDVNLLRVVPGFAELNRQELRELWDLMAPESFAADEVVVDKGKKPKCLYVVDSGGVSIEKPDGACLVLRSGSCFGPLWLLHDLPAESRILASGTTTLLVLTREEMAPFLVRNPEAAVKIHQAMSATLALRLTGGGRGGAS